MLLDFQSSEKLDLNTTGCLCMGFFFNPITLPFMLLSAAPPRSPPRKSFSLAKKMKRKEMGPNFHKHKYLGKDFVSLEVWDRQLQLARDQRMAESQTWRNQSINQSSFY